VQVSKVLIIKCLLLIYLYISISCFVFVKFWLARASTVPVTDSDDQDSGLANLIGREREKKRDWDSERELEGGRGEKGVGRDRGRHSVLVTPSRSLGAGHCTHCRAGRRDAQA
jgi:hypothetical protein